MSAVVDRGVLTLPTVRVRPATLPVAREKILSLPTDRERTLKGNA